MEVKIIKTLRFGATFGIFLYLLNWLIGLMMKNGGQPQASLNFIPTLTEGARANIQALPTDLASRLMAWISGISPWDWGGLIIMVITGAIVALVGAYIVEWIKGNAIGKFISKSELRYIVGTIVIGSVVVTGLVNAFAGNPQLPAFMGTLTMVIYFTIFAFMYRGLQTLLPASKKQVLVSPQ